MTARLREARRSSASLCSRTRTSASASGARSTTAGLATPISPSSAPSRRRPSSRRRGVHLPRSEDRSRSRRPRLWREATRGRGEAAVRRAQGGRGRAHGAGGDRRSRRLGGCRPRSLPIFAQGLREGGQRQRIYEVKRLLPTPGKAHCKELAAIDGELHKLQLADWLLECPDATYCGIHPPVRHAVSTHRARGRRALPAVRSPRHRGTSRDRDRSAQATSSSSCRRRRSETPST